VQPNTSRSSSLSVPAGTAAMVNDDDAAGPGFRADVLDRMRMMQEGLQDIEAIVRSQDRVSEEASSAGAPTPARAGVAPFLSEPGDPRGATPMPHAAPASDAGKLQLVLEALDALGQASALQVAKRLGLTAAREVNPSLYSLMKEGRVVKLDIGGKPLWERAAQPEVRNSIGRGAWPVDPRRTDALQEARRLVRLTAPGAEGRSASIAKGNTGAALSSAPALQGRQTVQPFGHRALPLRRTVASLSAGSQPAQRPASASSAGSSEAFDASLRALIAAALTGHQPTSIRELSDMLTVEITRTMDGMARSGEVEELPPADNGEPLFQLGWAASG